MKKTSFFTSLPFKLLVSVIVGIIAGLILSSTDSYSIAMGILNVVVTLKYILGQLINFCVPLSPMVLPSVQLCSLLLPAIH